MMIAECNELKISSILDSWARAVREGNLEAIAEHHSDNVVMFVEPYHFHANGIDAYRKTWGMMLSGAVSEPFHLMTLDVTVTDQRAFCLGRVRTKRKDADLMVELCRHGSRWPVTHEHLSYRQSTT